MSVTAKRLPPISRRRRPWWLLLTLALFLAGQTLAVGHRHDDSFHHPDNECALCVYASTATAAIGGLALPLAIALAAIAHFLRIRSVRRVVVRFCDARAPPVLPH